MNIFSEIKLALEAKKVIKTLISNGWQHAFTTVSGAVLAALIHFTGAKDAHSAALAILVFILGWIAKNPTGKNATAKVVAILALLFAMPAFAQTAPAPQIQNVYAAGVSWNQSATPAVAGTALYAHALDSSGTYAFTAIDILPTSTKPFTVTTNIGVGVAQKIFSIGKIPIFVPTTAGVSWSGTNTGWAWSTGGLASIKLGKKSSWHMFPMFRVARSNVSSGSGVQPIIGIAFGWGQ